MITLYCSLISAAALGMVLTIAAFTREGVTRFYRTRRMGALDLVEVTAIALALAGFIAVLGLVVLNARTGHLPSEKTCVQAASQQVTRDATTTSIVWSTDIEETCK